jgi:hypothetical protein
MNEMIVNKKKVVSKTAINFRKVAMPDVVQGEVKIDAAVVENPRARIRERIARVKKSSLDPRVEEGGSKLMHLKKYKEM